MYMTCAYRLQRTKVSKPSEKVPRQNRELGVAGHVPVGCAPKREALLEGRTGCVFGTLQRCTIMAHEQLHCKSWAAHYAQDPALPRRDDGITREQPWRATRGLRLRCGCSSYCEHHQRRDWMLRQNRIWSAEIEQHGIEGTHLCERIPCA